MSGKIKVDGVEYNYDEVPEAIREKYKDEFLEIDKLQSHIDLPPKYKAPLPKAFGYVFIASIFFIVGLSVLSFFSEVKTTIDIQSKWQFIYGIILVAVIGMYSVPFVTKRAAIPGGGFLKKFFAAVFCIVGLSVLCSFSVFSGLPIALHHLSSDEGTLKVTVSGKADEYDKRTCRPRLIIKEFTWFASNFICPGEKAYNEIDIGSELILKGNLSPFGIEVKQIQLKKGG